MLIRSGAYADTPTTWLASLFLAESTQQCKISPIFALRQHQDKLDKSLPYGFYFPLNGRMQWVDRNTWQEFNPKISAVGLTHQIKFLQDITTRSTALCAGYGAGKSFGMCLKAIQLAGLNQGYAGTLYSATYELATQVLMPDLEELLQTFKIPYTPRQTPLPKLILHLPGGDTKIFIRAFENKARIISYNLAWAGIDEIDTVKPALARSAWLKLQGRMRSGNVRQIFTGSTPEGFGFMYEYFESERLKLIEEGKDPNRRLIRASSHDNPFLPEDFLQRLYDEYPAELVAAYVNGEFVNMTGNTVYYCYDRKLNNSDRLPNETDVLYIGMDFNIGQMAAVVYVDDEDGNPHAVAELAGIFDTPAMIDALRQRFPQHLARRMVRVYPDASGKARKTVGGTDTDHSLLAQAGFMVLTNPSNPAVRDRVNSVNAMFCNSKGVRRLRVNFRACPKLANALEQQTWVDGQPDKTRGIDHELDAAGYPIAYRFPIVTGGWNQTRAMYG